MEDRIMRVIAAIWLSESTIIGNIIALGESIPDEGSHPSCSENSRTSKSPIQKPGVETPISEKMVVNPEKIEFGFNAAKIPTGTAMITASATEVITRMNVFGKLTASMLITGSRVI